MIPTGYADLLNISFDNAKLITSQDFKLNYSDTLSHKYINGMVIDLYAMEQVVFKILNTQRYKFPIYSWNYGIELLDLFGRPVSYVCAELQRRICEALLQDERISAVNDFSFDTSTRHIVIVKFVVTTIFGKLNYSKEVDF